MLFKELDRKVVLSDHANHVEEHGVLPTIAEMFDKNSELLDLMLGSRTLSQCSINTNEWKTADEVWDQERTRNVLLGYGDTHAHVALCRVLLCRSRAFSTSSILGITGPSRS